MAMLLKRQKPDEHMSALHGSRTKERLRAVLRGALEDVTLQGTPHMAMRYKVDRMQRSSGCFESSVPRLGSYLCVHVS